MCYRENIQAVRSGYFETAVLGLFNTWQRFSYQCSGKLYCQIPLTVFDTEPLLLRKPQEYRI